ncbi:TPA: protein translocase subunit SecD [Legionella pneumophila subsp. pneumophila]|uniref:Protein translocase subunit SecD n=1 Tax=Legionella pneumophila (strain Lens) TaxID=297245 RepID=Q5WV40_LEGPL|nr:protein translocase subunit SecD [Legionella pneumophila]AOW51486.1 protein-export membrane protein SecD [Legionella pneumophila subsp. pneumophila]AOW54917.1 protein-export membrane protein SecD [Legionella pneumophila subsp. pneumophila]AOW56771.1 protein-export membrane protein SecD [Legionella pneumophila subsp. pneumophila]AOW60301.1 protein-export membrane protein SecD [Legionella pneumophila subsp. pneumophila]AOW64993.1 protein-export membrane protein SecD [Legionella pneumophila su
MQNKYPLWKNLMLIVIAVIGFVYAIPNLYTENPVVQISAGTDEDTETIKNQVESILKNANMDYKSLVVERDGVEVVFSSTDSQLLARDVIKNSLGSDYTVALNLAPSTPAWLEAIHADPMKQGLDLRGGVHFLLEVDVESVISRRYEGIMKNIGQELREAGIRYSGIRYLSDKGIELRFRDSDSMENALVELRQKISDVVFVKTKTQNSILGAISPAELNSIRQNTIEQTMSILRNRVNELGVGEAVVQQQGATRVAVDLPGIQDAARAKQILGGTATLEFHLVDQENDPFIAKQTGVVPVNDKLYMMDGHPILLKRQVVLSGDSITSAVSSFDQQTASPSVQIQLGGGGESLFTKVTRENIGKRMAIVFVETKTTTQTINGEEKRVTKKEERVISAPVIQNALGSNFQITGLTDSKEASNLALLLRAGALPAAIYPVEERTVGPTLGKENIRRGLISLEVGMGLILALMLVYYHFFGLIADIALMLNLVFLCALLSIIDATLTLPGIAGIVLTVGMAVDANVLIYERIREELRNGLSPQAAIHAGYERAFSTILDANVTTLIVAIILFAVGTGPVRGFAVVLSLGLLTSMLTGITYTRAIVNWYYGGRNVKKLSIGI